MKYHLMVKSGRCANSAERDHGSVIHVVPDLDGGNGQWYAASCTTVPALCGTMPGRRSAGWQENWKPEIAAPTCPRCARKLANMVSREEDAETRAHYGSK